MSKPVIILYGYGANVGASVLQKFAADGWKTAAIVRTLKEEYKSAADLVLQVDFAHYEAIQRVYDEVESKLGTPRAVAYNAYSNSALSSEAGNPFGAAPSKLATDLATNTVSFYAAAQSAARGFAKLKQEDKQNQLGPRVFIYTGNPFPTQPVAEIPGLGGGKSASSYIIETASKSLGKATGSRWYFADERATNGLSIMGHISGKAHAEVFTTLVNSEEQLPWNYTFVNGKGYVKFNDTADHQNYTFQEMMDSMKQ